MKDHITSFVVKSPLMKLMLFSTWSAEKGELYAFGQGKDGQLGLGVSVSESVSPSLLKLPFKVSQVSCGENFTAIISGK